MDKTYQEFEIHLKKKSKDNYIAEVVDSDGKIKASKSFMLEMDKLKMREDLKHLELLAISSELVKDEFHINFGKHIFNLVFGDGIKTYYDECLMKDQTLRIRIRIDESARELNDIPWEFLHDGKNFLVTQSETLISRLPLDVEKKEKGNLNQAISMLVVISNPLNLPEHMVLNIEKEQEVILEALDKLQRERKLDIDFVDDASLETIQDYLSEKDYHILHFTGHGIFDENKDKAFLLLEDSGGRMANVDNETIATILQNYKSLRLVVLSACQSAKASNNTGYPYLARDLLRKGIPAILSMQYSISDPSAIDFAGKFYRSLAGGKPVDVALSDARLALYVGEKKNRVDFATPVLFLNDPNAINVANIKVEEEKFELKKKPFDVGLVALMKTGFVGRRKELRIIREGFESGRKRAFIIHGFGGIGKSVLATRAGLKLEDHFDGVKAIKFRPTTKPEDILNDLNGFLMVASIHELNKYIHEPISIENKTHVLINILNQIRLLIIFDNFEDVLTKETNNKISDPDLEKFIQLLLNGVAENTKFIFTSRYDFDPLDGRLSGHIGKINLPELSFPFMVFLMNNFEELEMLSVEKKSEIYKKIGGHPYTLGIFTKHARTTSVDQLLLNLAPVTKEMMEFTLLDMTYSKLSDRAKTLLKRVSVFEESVPLEALQWMMGDEKDPSPDVGEELKSLIGWGLVAKTERWRAMKVGDKIELMPEEVYIMHQLVKDFASERLSEDKTEDRKKLLIKAGNFYETYVQISKIIWDLLRTRDYYYKAEEYVKADDIVNACTELLMRWGYIELIIKLLNESISTSEGTNKARALGNLAVIYGSMGDYQNALEKFNEIKCIFEKEGKRKHVADILHNLGNIHYLKGEHKEALTKYEESLKIEEELGDKKGIAITLHQLGMIHQAQGNDKEAVKKYEQSLKIANELGDKSQIALTLHQLGMIHQYQSDYKEAVKKYEQSLKISEELGDKSGIAYTLHQLGIIHQTKGNYPKAIKEYEESLKIKEELGDKSGIAQTLHQLGRINEEQKDYKEAMRKYLIALTIFQELGSPNARIAASDLARLREKMGEKEFEKVWKEITGEPPPA
jgi:tetratricopeptide (TPR) repeat protein